MTRACGEMRAAAVAYNGEISTDGRDLVVVVLPAEARELRPPHVKVAWRAATGDPAPERNDPFERE